MGFTFQFGHMKLVPLPDGLDAASASGQQVISQVRVPPPKLDGSVGAASAPPTVDGRIPQARKVPILNLETEQVGWRHVQGGGQRGWALVKQAPRS